MGNNCCYSTRDCPADYTALKSLVKYPFCFISRPRSARFNVITSVHKADSYFVRTLVPLSRYF